MGWYTSVIVCCSVLDEDKLDAINKFFSPDSGLKPLDFGARSHPQAEFFAGVFKVASSFRAAEGSDSSLAPGTDGWLDFLDHLRKIPWRSPEAVRVLVNDEYDVAFTLYEMSGLVAVRSPKE